MQNQTELESQVIDALEQMRNRYQQLDNLTQAMMAKHNEGQPFVSEIERMNQQRAELMELEKTSAPLNDAYRASRPHASKQVRQLIQRTATLIEQVIATIANLETVARQSYERLTPQINRSVKGNQMKQAYGNFGQ